MAIDGTITFPELSSAPDNPTTAQHRIYLNASGHLIRLNSDGSTHDYDSGGSGSPLTTKGDIWVYSTTDDRLGVGSDGQVLTANSAATSGLSWAAAASGSGDVVGPSSSVDSEIALFNSTTGKLIKRATGSGIAKVTSGVLSTVTAPSGTIVGTSDSQTLTNKTIDAASNTITNIGNSEVKAAAGIAVNKLAALTVSKAVKTDSSGFLASSTASAASLDALSGTNTGDQTISLTGDVTGSGTGSFAATIAVGAVTDTKGSLANKPACTVVATSNLTLSGVQTIDGQLTVAATSIVLATGQTAGAENGPWIVQSGAWTRPTWYPSGGITQAFQFVTTLIRLGTTYQGSTWRQTTAAPLVIDTDATAWVVTPFALNATTTTGIGSTVQAWDADLDAVAALSSTGLAARTGSNTWAQRTLTGPAAGITVSNGSGAAGNPTLALANDLSAVEGLSTNGLAARTATDTWTTRTLTGPAAGITVSNGDGVSGNPTLALANDLSALEGLSGTGFATRTGTDTWANRTDTGTANHITVTNGDGVSGNPTFDLAARITDAEATFVFDGGGAVLTTGAKKAYVRIPFDCTIASWDIVCDQSGSIQFDVWVQTYASFPPLVAQTITASAKPLVSSAQKAQSSTLTGWTTSLTKGSYIEINIDSVTTVTKAILTLVVTK